MKRKLTIWFYRSEVLSIGDFRPTPNDLITFIATCLTLIGGCVLLIATSI